MSRIKIITAMLASSLAATACFLFQSPPREPEPPQNPGIVAVSFDELLSRAAEDFDMAQEIAVRAAALDGATSTFAHVRVVHPPEAPSFSPLPWVIPRYGPVPGELFEVAFAMEPFPAIVAGERTWWPTAEFEGERREAPLVSAMIFSFHRAEPARIDGTSGMTLMVHPDFVIVPSSSGALYVDHGIARLQAVFPPGMSGTTVYMQWLIQHPLAQGALVVSPMLEATIGHR